MDRELLMIDGLNRVLIAQGSITQNDAVDMHEAFKASEIERYEEFLADEEVVSKADLLKALQTYYELPALDVVGLLLDHDLVTKFPKEIMLENGFVPYQQDGDVLQVIAARPADADLLEVIGEYVSYDVVFLVGLHRDICDAVKEFYDESLTVVHEEEEFTEDIEDIVDEE